MIAMFKLFYNTIAACQRPVGPLLSNKCMYVCMYVSVSFFRAVSQSDFLCLCFMFRCVSYVYLRLSKQSSLAQRRTCTRTVGIGCPHIGQNIQAQLLLLLTKLLFTNDTDVGKLHVALCWPMRRACIKQSFLSDSDFPGFLALACSVAHIAYSKSLLQPLWPKTWCVRTYE